MEPHALWIFLICAFGAEVLGTMAGFGAATVLTPVASFFMAIKTAVAVVACFHLCGNASRIYFFRRHINWTIVKQFGVPGVVMSFGGAQLAARLPASAVRLLLGVFLLAYVIVELTRVMAVQVPATKHALMIGGLGSGLIAGIIGTGGAIRSVCLLAFGLPKEAYIGTSAVIALLVDATRLPVYVAQQFMTLDALPLIVGLIPIAFGGAWLGQWLVRLVPARRFTQFVLAMLFLMGVKLCLDGLRGIG